MRVYLKKGTHIIKSSIMFFAFGEKVEEEEIQPYIEIAMEPPFTSVLPKDIIAVVEKFSYRKCILDEIVCRTSGIYQWKDAKAELTKGYSKGVENLNTIIHIEGKSLENISELYTLVCGGLIHPTVSYEEPTVPLPVRNIRQLFREIGAVIRRDIMVWWSQKTHR